MYDHLWGLNSKHRHDVQQDNAELIKNKLSRLKVKRCDCSSWMQELVADYSHEPRVEGEYATHVSNEKLIVFWLKKLFAELRTLANQFNDNLDEDYMFIEATEPEFHTVVCNEAPAPGKPGKEIYFEAHFVSRTAALLLRGFDHEIDVFIVPADVWLGISLNTIDQKDYPPILRLNLLSRSEAEPILSDAGEQVKERVFRKDSELTKTSDLTNTKTGTAMAKGSANSLGSASSFGSANSFGTAAPGASMSSAPLAAPAAQAITSPNKEASVVRSYAPSSTSAEHIDPEHINELARMLFKELIKASLR